MYRPEDNEMVTCPYDNHHVVSKLRIQKHIMKCQKNNPDIKLVPCFYNFSHKLKPEELLSHYEICSHKTRLDSAQYVEPVTYASSEASERNSSRNNCPVINVRTKFFSDSSYPSSQARDARSEISNYSYFSQSENKGSKIKALKETVLKSKYYNEDSDNSDDSDDLKPLPLPKTVSKAFVIPKDETKTSNSSSSSSSVKEPNYKKLGRGKILKESLQDKKQIGSDHTLPDLSERDNDLTMRRTNSNFSLKDRFSSCSASMRSLKLDDESTIKSDDIIFDDDFD